MAGEFWSRIKRLYPQQQGPRAPAAPPRPQPAQPRQISQPIPSQQQLAPQPVEQQMGPLDMQGKIAMIHEAGRNLKMLEIKYNGVDRLVEGYSFRQGKTGLLFYGHCSIHDSTHSFKLDKIEDIKISEFGYVPRWEVEL